MSNRRYLWRVYCLGFNHYATVYSETEPTSCPTDGSPIDPDQTVIVEASFREITTEGYIFLDSSLADNQAIVIKASDANGGIDIDAGFGGIAIDTTNSISLDAAAASNFTTTNGNLSLLATNGLIEIHAPNTSTGGINIGTLTTPLIIIGNTNGTSALTLQSGTGGINANSLGDYNLTATGQLTLLSTSATDDAITLDTSGAGSGITMLTGSGGLLMNSAAGQIEIGTTNTAVDAVRIDTSGSSGGIFLAAGSSGISIGNDGVAHPINIGNFVGGTGVTIYAGTGNVDINSTQTVTVSANTSVNVGNTAGTVVNIGNTVGGTAVTIDAGFGAINIGNNSANPIRIGATLGSNQVFIRRGTGGLIQTQPAHITKSTSSTLTASEVLTSIINADTGSITLTLPTAAEMVAGIPLAINDDSVDFSIINTGGASVTLTPGVGGTILGDNIISVAETGSFRLRLTSVSGGSEAYIVYRLN